MFEDRERFFSRLSTIAGLEMMPSLGSWILVCVEDPSDLARKVNRRTEPGTVSVPRQVAGAVRIPVCSPKENEALYGVIREVMRLRSGSVRRVVG
jgi:histidinol-phosphate/aromatic aminotransferase/cobyric acid decarboxylase-like protein